jgi:uncharacterized repeat protein (TIGR01451 family)
MFWTTRLMSALRTSICKFSISLALWSSLVGVHAEAGQQPPAPQPGAAHVADLYTLIRTGRALVVQFDAPAEATIDIASSGGVVQLKPKAKVVLATGQVYCLRVRHATEKADRVIYPTLQTIGYTVPPANVDPLAFPTPIHILDQDIEDAAAGRLVSNVVYLEDPTSAFPMAFPRGEIPIIDIRPGEDALERASKMGRPIAFIQLGNRVPIDDVFEGSADDPPLILAPDSSTSPAGAAAAVRQASAWQHAARLGTLVPAGLGHRKSCDASCAAPSTVRQPYKVHPRMPRDEYICDGGDQVPHVHFTGPGTVAGLAPTETTAQFTRQGQEKPRVVTSNQTCIYAPRFGMVRATVQVIGSDHAEGPRGVSHELRRKSLETRTALAKSSKADQVRSLRRREQLGRLAMHEPLGAVDELRVIDAMHSESGLVRFDGKTGPNEFGQADDPHIAAGMDAARVWNRPQFPAYTALTEGGGQLTGAARTGEVVHVREGRRAPGELYLLKIATPDNAQQGDVVDFAIFYRNIGDRPVESVSILDSLSGRLDYIAGSAQTDRRSVFTATPNDAESHELRWDISDPLAGGESGVVWFKAKVR